MTLLQAIILGIVQGLTEFIPISSTAHLVLAGRVMDLPLSAEQTTASIAVIQLGTLIAVMLYFASDILKITSAFVRDHVALLSGRRRVMPGGATSVALSREAWLGWLVIIGSIPVGLVGLLLKKQIEGTFTKSLWVIATMMIVVGLLLVVAEIVSTRKRGLDDLGMGDALAIGCAQVLSLIPGSSRSGSTIMAGLFMGQTRETAARFSFLLSIPAIAASGLLELKEALHNLPQSSLVPLALATLVSAIVGYASIWFLLRFLRTHTTGIFIGYRLILGAVILALLFSGRLSSQSEARPIQVETRSAAASNASV
jgi:undecaprenyl-diphosphatase